MEHPKKKSRYRLRTRLLIGLGGLLFWTALLEAGLRVAGRVHLARTAPERISAHGAAAAPGALKILCVGDSFTVGSRAPDCTYPMHLATLLAARAGAPPCAAINQGVCEYNSWQLRRFLPAWLDRYDPDVVCLLVGAANRFNPWGFDFDGTHASLGRRVAGFFRGLRVVKLLRITALNLRSRLAAGRAPGERRLGIDGREEGPNLYVLGKNVLRERLAVRGGGNAAQAAWARFNGGDREGAATAARQALDAAPDDPELLCALGYFLYERQDFAGADAQFRRALQAAPTDGAVTGLAAFFYSNAGRDSMKLARHDDAIEYLFRGIDVNPDDEYLYYAMVKAFDFQSRYDAGSIIAQCRERLARRPKLARNPKFMNHLRMFEGKQDWEGRVRAWLDGDLDAIVELCRRHGARVVVQNYPIHYPLANDALAALAARHGLPLVDNTRAFDALIAADGRDRYLLDDDHCTAEGHRRMADNVYAVLTAQGVLAR